MVVCPLYNRLEHLPDLSPYDSWDTLKSHRELELSKLEKKIDAWIKTLFSPSVANSFLLIRQILTSLHLRSKTMFL